MARKIKVFLLMFALTLALVGCGESEPKHTLTVEGQRFETLDGRNIVAVYTTYTNKSGESALPADWFDVKAYQNGVEIPVIVYTGTKHGDYIQCDTSVQDGTTAKVVWTFETDSKDEVSVEVKELW